MSIEQANEILDRVRSDSEFRERLGQTERSDHIAVLRSEGYDTVEPEHLDHAVQQEMTDEELAGVAGGSNFGDWLERIGHGFSA